jgi:IclR family KDG regulon transcriptional repressor
MRTIERAFAVIECFSPKHSDLTLQEIADRIGLAKSTTFRLVGSLEKLGYLLRLPDRRYSLSLQFARLAGIAGRNLDIRRLMRPVLEDLVMASGENVSLNCVRGRFRHCVDVARSKVPLIGMNKPGEDLPLGLGAASMVLMAHMSPPVLRGVIAPAAAAAKCSMKELNSILETTRLQGYAVSHGGGVRLLTGIAAPIFDTNGSVEYALTIVVPTSRVAGRMAELVDLAKQAAVDASHRLGGPVARKRPRRRPSHKAMR